MPSPVNDKPYRVLATYRLGQPTKEVAAFEDREAAEAFVERAKGRYDEVFLVVTES